MFSRIVLCLVVLSFGMSPAYSQSEEKPDPQSGPVAIEQPVSVAILDVYEKGREVAELGPKIEALLLAELTASPDLMLVERKELEKVLSETELNLSGIVDPKTAARIGHMTGAKVLVSSAAFQVDNMFYIVAKVIGVETTRVVGVSVKSDKDNELAKLVTKLAHDIDDTIKKRKTDLLAPAKKEEDRIASIKSKIGEAELPVLAIEISETHLGRGMLVSSAHTELVRICKAIGFTVVETKKPYSKQPDLILTGNALSEFAVQRQNLVGVRGRVALNAKKRDGTLIVADTQTVSKVDLTEQIAGKVAVEEAALSLAERILPTIVQEWNRK